MRMSRVQKMISLDAQADIITAMEHLHRAIRTILYAPYESMADAEFASVITKALSSNIEALAHLLDTEEDIA
jgi:hypothetical protein